ncbi:hypothetical protein CISIN_1g042327mg [Citrus sinensis]|uniref:Uncharacterized protein n=1 Tax=Citrus sinensis TaxID=2711 RepID=A0A067DFP1_CITSI|nr:hypothetical protein CISIN_1g042327mg [Citrus sinensis]
MGNICSITVSCDAIFSRCLDCTVTRAAYISELQANIDALRTERQRLIEARNDVLRKVAAAEQQRMRRLNKVQGWLSRVEAVEADADKLIRDSPQEIEKLCLGGYCSKNFKSSYNFGKQVAKTLSDVATSLGEGAFEVVAERVLASVAVEKPTDPTVVGLESTLQKVWRCIVEDPAVIIGIYGMGGVGKTTLLTHINNKFLEGPNTFDCVIWVVVSKDLRVEYIQEVIAKQMGFFDDSWRAKSVEEKALEIFNSLSEKKFVLLLDDVWERVDLTKVGVPLPRPKNMASKVVFTTRSEEVCGFMEAHRKFKMVCLSDNDSWDLFQQKVGKEILNSHPDILELAQTVARECGGLPLALITIGRAMACKKTPEEWRYAIQLLSSSASQFPGFGEGVYPLLKFSYDSLPNDTIRSCLLYCSLYPEDYCISKENLIDCWIGEGLLNESDRFGEQNQGYFILGILLHACLLEEGGDGEVKMHDVIRDMSLWIACDLKEKENFLVYAGVGLTKAPDVREWENVRRLSLMQNEITNLKEIPTCPHLLTLFLDNNESLKIPNDFFQYMHSLKVLNLSRIKLKSFPLGISKLVSLQQLDLSYSSIKELPRELYALVNLKCLNLEHAEELITIPQQVISNFSRLHVLRMYGTVSLNFLESLKDSILFGGEEVLAEELLGLESLEVLTFTLRSVRALQLILISHKLRSCTQALFLQSFNDSTSLDVSPLADLKHLYRLRVFGCRKLEELKMDYKRLVQATRQPCVFHGLHTVHIEVCLTLKDLTFLVFAPNLKYAEILNCPAMEEIISAGKFADVPEVMGNLNPFAKLHYLGLVNLPNLRSIYWKPLSLPQLKEMKVDGCFGLKKLPLKCNSAQEQTIVVHGDKTWWINLKWEDEATQDAFRPCFKSLYPAGARWNELLNRNYM